MRQWFLELDYATVVIFISAIIALTVQLFLCFKAKRLLIRLLPIALLAASAIVFSVCSAATGGWDGFGYLFFALLSLGLIFVCGLAWAIWAIVRKRD